MLVDETEYGQSALDRIPNDLLKIGDDLWDKERWAAIKNSNEWRIDWVAFGRPSGQNLPCTVFQISYAINGVNYSARYYRSQFRKVQRWRAADK